jgi:hypothetical protein
MMILKKAALSDLVDAGRDLAQSDREEMDRVEPGRDPSKVLTLGAGPATMAIKWGPLVYAVGGAEDGYIWFVHTRHAESLEGAARLHLLRMLRTYLGIVRKNSPVPLANVVSKENHKHIKLLRYLGATFDTDHVLINGHIFQRFAFN